MIKAIAAIFEIGDVAYRVCMVLLVLFVAVQVNPHAICALFLSSVAIGAIPATARILLLGQPEYEVLVVDKLIALSILVPVSVVWIYLPDNVLFLWCALLVFVELDLIAYYALSCDSLSWVDSQSVAHVRSGNFRCTRPSRLSLSWKGSSIVKTYVLLGIVTVTSGVLAHVLSYMGVSRLGSLWFYCLLGLVAWLTLWACWQVFLLGILHVRNNRVHKN